MIHVIHVSMISIVDKFLHFYNLFCSSYSQVKVTLFSNFSAKNLIDVELLMLKTSVGVPIYKINFGTRVVIK